jgi:DNA mismatch repair protein MSH5
MNVDRVFSRDTGDFKMPLPPDFNHEFNHEDGLAFFKNSDMRTLDNEIGDLDALIKDKESMIVVELEENILDQELDLQDTFLALSELDCIISFAYVAKENNYIRPELLPAPGENSSNQGFSGIVRIKNGRHPLQEILVDDGDFIPNDTDINLQKRVNVVTGPNFSGKSCYARQVGILVYMAQIGAFLPCDAAQISIFDQIFAQFSRVETCAVPQSSFQLDVTQMGNILRKSTSRSLVLLDEFGKGGF